ncbi:MAG: VOC family protein [Oscillospiraceae bacterium]|nr:VOC family protein [Oscillospiraceae bacterium]
MSSKILLSHIFIDCKNPQNLRAFYHRLTGLEKRTMYDLPGLVASENLMLLFNTCEVDYIPPVWPEETGKQQKQMHLDFAVENLESAVEEAVRLGAVKAPDQYGGNLWVTLFDPEGHPFCLGVEG